ncbi:efflux RND transporter periplasmic adaptor subunit [Ramlibacter sp.]|uniref:efflux RND transporter periplasmic adaptor subunit n=1 Tax=Ramlibacter sp. TaxID=1917967 RepID=UPI0026322A8D|nr:efflux RND transporter periplasmic adaptor subunit [Ramlibacter sp.]MDB5955247.1 family efflux transporter subunit [Ramlibacter sp.]
MDRTTSTRTALAALSAALALQGCGPAKPPPAPPPPQVSVVKVHRESVAITMEIPGRTTAFMTAQVRARVDGIVLKRKFQEGSDVKVGQPLYLIDPAPYIAALNLATATLQKAQAELLAAAATVERYKLLLPTNAISKLVYDNAVAARDMAAADVATGKATVATAQINLGYTNVLSPITGRSGLSMVTEGAYVQALAATLMTTVQQIDPMYVDLTESSVAGLQLRRDIASGKLKVDGPDQAKVTLFLEDGTEYRLPGRLQFTDISVNMGTGMVTVRAIFPNPKFILLPGMFVRARIEQGIADDAMLVPQTGVTHDPQGKATALVVGADSKVAARTLTLGGTRDNDWIVQGGLNEGDRVIVAGVQKAQPGAVVQATEIQPVALAAMRSAASAAPPTTAPAPGPAAPAAAAASSAGVVSQAEPAGTAGQPR